MAAVTLYWLKLEYSFESELTVALLYNLAQWRVLLTEEGESGEG